MIRLAGLTLSVLLFAGSGGGARAETPDGAWTYLFNGRDLDGWTPKISGHPLGENYLGTFGVRDGVLRVSYDRYERFGNAFAHLFYKTPFSSYRLQLQYRFVGTDAPGAPPWAARNSGVMIHAQAPETMGRDQPFPISVEVQLLNGDGAEVRPTGAACTPGTTIVMDGQPVTDHCVRPKGPTYSDSRWVRLEVEVHGARSIQHTIDGQPGLQYERPRIDPTDLRAMEYYLARGAGDLALDGGYIALQGEGHPIEFRDIRIMPLPE